MEALLTLREPREHHEVCMKLRALQASCSQDEAELMLQAAELPLDRGASAVKVAPLGMRPPSRSRPMATRVGGRVTRSRCSDGSDGTRFNERCGLWVL